MVSIGPRNGLESFRTLPDTFLSFPLKETKCISLSLCPWWITSFVSPRPKKRCRFLVLGSLRGLRNHSSNDRQVRLRIRRTRSRQTPALNLLLSIWKRYWWLSFAPSKGPPLATVLVTSPERIGLKMYMKIEVRETVPQGSMGPGWEWVCHQVTQPSNQEQKWAAGILSCTMMATLPLGSCSKWLPCLPAPWELLAVSRRYCWEEGRYSQARWNISFPSSRKELGCIILDDYLVSQAFSAYPLIYNDGTM